jgi:hypothetical protein
MVVVVVTEAVAEVSKGGDGIRPQAVPHPGFIVWDADQLSDRSLIQGG